MLIIEKEATNGFHNYEEQSHRVAVWIDGYIEVPNNLADAVYDCGGFCDLNIQDGVLVGITSTLDSNQEHLENQKAARIAQSKTDLAAYLKAHPLLWSDGEYYSITAEKQAQLTSKVMAATMAQTMSADYHLTWNSTGNVCKQWTLPDLMALAFAIDSRVTALVTYQQTQEVAMRNAETLETLEDIVVDYDTVE